MPASWKCSECGLVNFASDASCKRCGTAAANAAVPAAPQATGIVLEDGYVLPPPSAMGAIWRDKSTLIMTKEAVLPDRCVRCNAPANGLRVKRNLSWHHPVLYLVIFVALIVYVILSVVISKRATVYFGLCAEHLQRRRNLLIVGWALLAFGLISPIVAFSSDYPEVGLLGILVLIISIVWLVLVQRVVKVKRIDDQLVWLKGIDSNYLTQFPPWQTQT